MAKIDHITVNSTTYNLSNAFPVSLTYSNNTYVLDKTYAEMVSAYTNGMDVFIVDTYGSILSQANGSVAHLLRYEPNSEFVFVGYEDGYNAIITIHCDSQDQVTTWTSEFAEWNSVETNFQKKVVILSYGSSTWSQFINAYNNNAVVYCRASSNSNPATGSQLRLAFMAYVNATTPTEVEFQYYRSVSSHTETQQVDQVYVYKLNKTSGWSVTTREAGTKITTTSPIVGTYTAGTSATMDLSHADSGVTAKTTQGLYPFTVDAKGHITGVGSAVTIPTVPDIQVNGSSIISSNVANIVTEGTYNASSNKIATMADLPSVPTITYGTSDPSGGSNGDIYIKYTAPA